MKSRKKKIGHVTLTVNPGVRRRTGASKQRSRVARASARVQAGGEARGAGGAGVWCGCIIVGNGPGGVVSNGAKVVGPQQIELLKGELVKNRGDSASEVVVVQETISRRIL